jgi:hypothetical protein
MAAVLGPVAGAATWLASEALDYLEERRKARENGLYYLMKFATVQ